MADRDPKASKRAERQVAALFGISVIGTIAALVVYFVIPPDGTTAGVRLSTVTLGVAIAFALLGIGLGAVHWAKVLMSDHEKVDERHPIASDPETRTAALAELDAGVRTRASPAAASSRARSSPPSRSSRSPSRSRSSGASAATGTSRSSSTPSGSGARASRSTLGPAHQGRRRHHRLGGPRHPRGVAGGDAVPRVDHGEGQGRRPPGPSRPARHRVRAGPAGESWSYDGIVAFSKICTHVGCPVALYEQQTHHLLCPCHQSTFDVADSAKVVFGPAKRPLPQLPITVDDEGYLVAQSDFHEPIGPSFWERLK